MFRVLQTGGTGEQWKGIYRVQSGSERKSEMGLQSQSDFEGGSKRSKGKILQLKKGNVFEGSGVGTL